MKWTIQEGNLAMSLTPDEAVIIADIVKTKMKVLGERRERYHDNIANGASEKYARLYDKAETAFDNANYFIRLVDEYRKNLKK